MGLIEDMRQALPTLTKTERRAAEAILADPSVVLNGSITKVAELTGTSNSALIRLSQKLGFNGFSEFRFSMNRARIAHEGAEDTSTGSGIEADVVQLASVYMDYIRSIPRYVTDEQVECLAQAIVNAKRLSIWGVNRTAESALQLSHRLTRLGIYNKWTDDTIVMTDDAEILNSGDVCIVLTLSGRGNPAYGALMETMRSRGVDVHLITMNKNLALGEKASSCYYLPWVSHDNSMNFFEDQIVAMMFIELVLLHVSRFLP